MFCSFFQKLARKIHVWTIYVRMARHVKPMERTVISVSVLMASKGDIVKVRKLDGITVLKGDLDFYNIVQKNYAKID